MSTLQQRLRQMADHTGLDAVAELLAALKRIEMAANATVCNTKWVAEHAKAAITKATGGMCGDCSGLNQ